jgi:tetratricopeptide (TPR) repeat protein
MQQKINNPDQNSAEFLGFNLEAINELATFAEISEGFTLAFAEVNFALDIQVLLKALKNHRRCQDIQFVVIEITDSELEFVLTELKERLQQTTIEPNKKIVIVVLGLERAIGFVETEKTPEVLENLNFARNVFTVQLPYPVIFILPDYALTRLARGARDFWAWASAVIAFRSGRQTIEQAHQQVFEPNQLFNNDVKSVNQERIDILLRLLTQYQPTLGQPDAEVAPLRLNILEELANAYLNLSDVGKAKQFFAEALSLAQGIGNKWAQANSLFGLGRTLNFLDGYDKALEKYDQALVIYKFLDNRLGEANTLLEIGQIRRFLDQPQEALKRYHEALKLFKAIGNRLGEANALQMVGDILRFLGQLQKALNQYYEALKLFKIVGDSFGEANTLKVVGDTLRSLDQPQEALNSYDKALTLYKTIGNSLGEANTLLESGRVLRFLDQPQEALNHYEEALRLFKVIGDSLGEANALRMIGDVLQYLEQRQEALNHYEEALQLYKAIGDRLGEANTLKVIGDVLMRQENIDEATFQKTVAHIETAYNLYCEIGDHYSQARILLTSLAPLYIRQGRRTEAHSAVIEAANIAQEIGFEPMQQHAASLLKTLEQEEP